MEDETKEVNDMGTMQDSTICRCRRPPNIFNKLNSNTYTCN